MAVALFAVLSTGALKESRRAESGLARAAFAFSGILLVIVFAGCGVEMFAPRDGLPTTIAVGGVGGLLLLTLLGPWTIPSLGVLLVVAATGFGLLSIPAVNHFFFGSTKEAFLLRWSYAISPSNPTDPEEVSPGSIKLTICDKLATVLANRSCEPGFPGAREFALTELLYKKRSFSFDTWAYFFTRPDSSERFVYAVRPYQDSKWGFLDAEDRIVRNTVAGLTNFGSTALAQNVLEPMASEEGLIWAARGGIETTVEIKDNLWLFLIVLVVVAFFLALIVFAWRVGSRAKPSAPA